MRIQESAEDYLEAILVLKQQKGVVHSIDVARHLNFSKPSVSAARIYERHQLLTRWFVELGVSEAQAAEDACRVEHDISAETFQKLKEHFGAI